VFGLREQVPALVALVPRLSLPLTREALGRAERAADTGEARHWRGKLLRAALVRLAEHGEGAESVDRARMSCESHVRATVLCRFIPHLAPALRDAVVAEVLGHLHGMSVVEGTHGYDDSWTVDLEASAALVPLGHGGELDVMLVGDYDHHRWISRVPDALEALGGAPAVIGAARACVEVGAWFP
jgi:hypothetical protein